MVSKGTSIRNVANFCLCRQYVKKVISENMTVPRLSRGGGPRMGNMGL
jgi:hypothetical protein